MLNLKNHPYFTEYTDPVSGVVSYILTERVSQMQQHFYFSECSLTDDGNYLWIWCRNPPSRAMHLSVVSMDPENPTITPFLKTMCQSSCPRVVPNSHDVIFSIAEDIWRMTKEGELTKLFSLPSDFINNRRLSKLSTHLPLSCDGRYIGLDADVGNRTYVGLADLETGEFKVLNSFDRHYDHMQFSPVDPELFLIDQDGHHDLFTGEFTNIDIRTWLMDTKQTRFEPLIANAWYTRGGVEYCHDFWSEDGQVCFVEYKKGAFECNVDTRELNHVWNRPLCHCHTRDRKLWTGDNTPYAWAGKPCKTLFFDRETSKEIEIFSGNPYPKLGRFGHNDPHPSFTKDSEYIISSTTVLGRTADVAITPVKPLLELCREKGTVV